LKARHFWPVGLALACLLLAGLACDEASPTGQSLPRTPSPSPTPTLPALNPTLQPTAEAIALERYATQSAIEVGAIEAQARATARAEQTRQAIRATREAQAWAATATTQERDYRATATRQAWEGMQTQEAMEATQAAEATAGALAFQATATRQAWEGYQTATAESAGATQAAYDATQQAYQATATRQAQQREEVLAYGRDYGIPVVLLVVTGGLCGLIVWGIRKLARRPVVIDRDFRGDAKPLALPVEGGGWTFVDVDRQPGPGDHGAAQRRGERATTAQRRPGGAHRRPRPAHRPDHAPQAGQRAQGEQGRNAGRAPRPSAKAASAWAAQRARAAAAGAGRNGGLSTRPASGQPAGRLGGGRMNGRTAGRNTTDEVIVYWRQIVGTLDQRGLVRQRPRQGGAILPVADAFLLPDRCIFALDMQRLGGIPREEWLKRDLWAQWRAALQGRRVFVSDGGGLAIQRGH
jgi:hypothetical protein